MGKNTCFFIGNHDTPEEMYPLVYAAAENSISKFGITSFIVGHYGNFDRLAAKAVQELKRNYPFITLTLLRPYHPAERPFPIPDGFDDSIYPPGMERIPKPFAIFQANLYCIDHCDLLITYSCNTLGNTFKLLKHAKQRQKSGILQIENLAQSAK